MTITTDFETQYKNRDVAELAIKIRAGLEYTKRVLDEQIETTEKAIADKHYADVPKSIKDEGVLILNELKACRNKMIKDHSEFLTIK